MPWSRRELVRAGGLGLLTPLVGCTRSGRFKTYRIETDPLPATLEAAFSVEAVQGPHEEEPALLRLGIECAAEAPRTYEAARGLPLAFDTATRFTERGMATDERLVLAPLETRTGRRNGCWRLSDAVDPEPRADAFRSRRRFGPGERIEVLRQLVNEPGTAGCYPPGEYRFSDRYRVETDDGDGRAARWGFTLTIRSMI